jgi:methionyl aminopeptidase
MTLGSQSMRAALTQGQVSPLREVPPSIPRPEYVGKREPKRTNTTVQTPAIVDRMRVAGRLAAQAVVLAGEHCKPGVTTDELDAVVHEFLVEHDAYPSTLGYKGFPKSCCTSLNEVICHGIPDSTVIEDGDIVNVDVTAFLDGVHGDTNQTFCVGNVSEEAQLLVDRTREATMRGVKAVAPGRPLNVIGRVIEAYAKRFGYGVVRDFGGHGIGESFHSGLFVPHYDNPRLETVMEPGMTFTIEPMITLGTYKHDMWNDGWTVLTKDRRWTAQFEHMVVVTDSGYEILTLP